MPRGTTPCSRSRGWRSKGRVAIRRAAGVNEGGSREERVHRECARRYGLTRTCSRSESFRARRLVLLRHRARSNPPSVLSPAASAPQLGPVAAGVLVGFTTFAGTVTAAAKWEAVAECRRVRPAAGSPSFMLWGWELLLELGRASGTRWTPSGSASHRGDLSARHRKPPSLFPRAPARSLRCSLPL